MKSKVINTFRGWEKLFTINNEIALGWLYAWQLSQWIIGIVVVVLLIIVNFLCLCWVLSSYDTNCCYHNKTIKFIVWCTVRRIIYQKDKIKWNGLHDFCNPLCYLEWSNFFITLILIQQNKVLHFVFNMLRVKIISAVYRLETPSIPHPS